MLKRITALLLVLTFVMTLSPTVTFAKSPDDLLDGTIEYEGEIINYKYREENETIVYAEVDNYVVEKVDNEVFVDGRRVATINVVSPAEKENSAGNTVMPRSGWMWSTTGNDSDYTFYDSETVNVTLELSYALIDITTLANVIVLFLPISGEAKTVATIIIQYVSDKAATYLSSKELYYVENIYKHKYIGLSYAKKLNFKFYLNEALTKEVPNSERTVYGSWG